MLDTLDTPLYVIVRTTIRVAGHQPSLAPVDIDFKSPFRIRSFRTIWIDTKDYYL